MTVRPTGSDSSQQASSKPGAVQIMKTLGIDLIWMGILIVKLLELAMITPPVGLNLFVIKSMMPNTPLEKIIRQVVWFIAIDLVTLSLLIAFPAISTTLPSLLK
jgi:TRAP-type C4-dicarboxylate transport system permease large subunit